MEPAASVLVEALICSHREGLEPYFDKNVRLRYRKPETAREHRLSSELSSEMEEEVYRALQASTQHLKSSFPLSVCNRVQRKVSMVTTKSVS